MRMKIKKTDFAKRLSPHTRGWLDAKDWRKLLPIIRDVVAEILSEGNSVQTDWGEFYCKENFKHSIKSPLLDGKEVFTKNKYQVRCSCSEKLKELVNGKYK